MILAASAAGKVGFAGISMRFFVCRVIIGIMSERFLKQLLYGVAYFLIIAAIIFGIYRYFSPEPSCFDNRRNQGEEDIDCGGPCQSCEIKRLQPIQVSRERALFVANDTASLSAELRNPNVSFGAGRFEYRWELYGRAGNLIKSITGNSFVYPGEVKYLIEPDVAVSSAAIGSVKLIIVSPDWLPLNSFSLPKITAGRSSTAITDEGIRTEGLVLNGEAFDLPRLRVIGVLFDKNGSELAVSATELRDVRAFEQRFFTLVFPRSLDRTAVNVQRTKVFVETKLIR